MLASSNSFVAASCVRRSARKPIYSVLDWRRAQSTHVSSTVLIGVEHISGVEHSPHRRRARLNVEHSP
ncbi:hypothetical protein A2U01_0088952, partial [Trifolium medium]|nr:hypothetical protein [Trifolium medium]